MEGDGEEARLGHYSDQRDLNEAVNYIPSNGSLASSTMPLPHCLESKLLSGSPIPNPFADRMEYWIDDLE